MIAVFHVPFTGFEIPFEIVVLGLINGLTYALLGTGLAMIYKASRVVNFAHGEMGSLASAVIPLLVINNGWNYWIALVLAIMVGIATGFFMEFVPIRKLARAPRLIVLVATIGAAQFFFALNTFIPKGENLVSAVFPTPFKATLKVGNLRLGAGQLLILIAVPAITIALTLFFRFTVLGTASRAAADNNDAARLAGVPVRKVSLVMWTIAGLLSAVSAILLGPTRPVVNQSALGPTLMLRGLGAAMIGGMVSLPGAFVSGLFIGVVEILVAWNYPTGGALEVVLFAVILLSMLLRRGLGRLTRGGEGTSWSLAGAARSLEAHVAQIPRIRQARAGMLALLLAFAILLPLPMGAAHRVLLASIAVFAVMGLSLTVLTGYAGQVSLGQFAFVALGALVGGRMHQLGYPPWMCLFYAMCAGGLVAFLIGLPALRIRGLFLAVASLGFAVASNAWLFQQPWLFRGGAQTSAFIPRPRWLGIDFASELNYYYLCLAFLVVVAAVVYRLGRTGVGRAMMAVRDNEPAAASLGISPRRAKLLAFVTAGVIASAAGYFYGGLLVTFQEATFAPELSLALVGMVILGGVTTVSGAILGAIWLQGGAYFLAPLLPNLIGGTATVIFGGVGLLLAVLQFPGGIVEVAFKVRDRIVALLVEESRPVTAAAEAHSRPRLAARIVDEKRERPPSPAIEARNVVVRYGGNLALDGVDLYAAAGEIVGLVGPNGAGKTTLFDVLSGHAQPDSGRVFAENRDITSLRPEKRAALGIGRTFQQARLFDEMTLRDVIKVALESEDPSEYVPSALGLPPSRTAERRKNLRAGEILDMVGLGGFADRQVNELSTGMRRFAELASMIALGTSVLLLDEPTAGIAQREVEVFQPILREIRDHLDATIVVIEHDIPMIMQLVDRLYVLAAGRTIGEGLPESLRTNPRVIAAYLGSDERFIQRSGALAAASPKPEAQ